MSDSVITVNKKARFDYSILESFEAGIVLKGTEVKSLRRGLVNLAESYAVPKSGEIFLVNATIAEYSHGNINNHEPRRSRKLLLHRDEILKLMGRLSSGGLTLVPLKLYYKNNRIKLELGLAKPKLKGDKRETIKRREDMREAERAMKRKR